MLKPLIAVCGTTGVGKSKLAVDLALYLNNKTINGWRGAKIINADSMQVYEGLDVLTNKIPKNEMKGIEHLLMGYRKPGEQYLVGQWVKDALNAVEFTHSKGQIPIVVGGTSYWIQHLLFPDRLASFENSTPLNSSTKETTETLDVVLAQLTTDQLSLFNALPEQPPTASEDADAAYALYTLLSVLDPPVAARWHWRDTRKVHRSLAIIKETGRMTSEIITAQDEMDLSPRYNTLFFWLHADPTVLNPRLNARVDEMIDQGLLGEIRKLQEVAKIATPLLDNRTSDEEKRREPTDYTLGIYQAIGYREFHTYLNSPNPSEAEYKTALDEMKLSTRRYAKRQVSWLRNKLLPAIYAVKRGSETNADIFLLDASDPEEGWCKNVRDLAQRLTGSFLQGQDLPDPQSLSETANLMLHKREKYTSPIAVLNARRKRICPTCSVDRDRPVMIEEGGEWEVHKRTKKHRRLANPRNGREEWLRTKATQVDTQPNIREQTTSDSSNVHLGSLTEPVDLYA